VRSRASLEREKLTSEAAGRSVLTSYRSRDERI
jgi:hypothetical protein